MGVKISALPPAGTLADDDETPFVDDSVGSTKKFTLAGLKAWLQSLTNWITAPMLATNAILLGHTATTSNFTSSSASAVQLTGLTLTVTIPAGGRSLRIEALLPQVTNNSTVTTPFLEIWDGAVGSGTKLQGVRGASQDTSSYERPIYAYAIINAPAAGSKTFNVGVGNTAGKSMTYNASATQPNTLTATLV